jgi:choline dehydrogenase-like flavoprotein
VIESHANYSQNAVYDADVVIVGTGAGGAPVGTQLAQAGFNVLFVEEGGYHPTSSFNPYVSESIPRLFRDGGATVIFGNPPIPFVEGRCVGGSTVINGGMTWRTPETVLAEWETSVRDDSLSAQAMAPYFERVEERISAKGQHPVSVGHENAIMYQGAKKMGWDVEINHRNQELCVGTNNCIFGCPTGAKQSTLVSYMPKALAAGAGCLTEVRIEEVLQHGGHAVGVQGRAINPRTRKLEQKVTVRAKIVIIACGAIQTPYLLLKHKLGRPSKQLGRNFFCHPNAKVLALYPNEVKGWQGVSQFSQIRQFRDEGIILADNMIGPGPMASNIPFHGSKAWDVMRRYNHSVQSGVLVEDSKSGRITRGPFGTAMARYDISAYDHARFLKGIKLLATMHFEMGADRVILPFSNLHEVKDVDELHQIEVSQIKPKTLELFTVHLMGTARMGATPETSVINSSGEMWDLKDCYVTDASTFPTPVGVNPQVSIIAMSLRIADRIAERAMKLPKVA